VLLVETRAACTHRRGRILNPLKLQAMKSFTKLSRTATVTGAVLAVALVATIAMPAQAAYVGEKTVSTARTAVMHLCQRFCGHHHHHHGHQWYSGGQDYWCPGH
jgi:hypothetical protein